MKSRIILLIAAVWLGVLSTASAISQWPLTVTNIAELKSLSVSWVESAEWASTTPSSPAVYVLGYYTPGDRGGGMFEWDPNSTGTPDGGLYFTTNGWISGNGRWVRRLNGEVANVKMWGANSYGTNECSSQIQNAIHSCVQEGLSDELIFPKGLYLVTNTIVFPRELHLRGESPYVTVMMHGDHDVFRTDNAQAALTGQTNYDWDHWVVFEDLGIQMDLTATTNAGLVLCRPGEASTIRNLMIIGGGHGIRVLGVGAPGLQLTDVRVGDQYIAGVSVEAYMPSGSFDGVGGGLSLIRLSGDHRRPDSDASASLVLIDHCSLHCSVYDFKAEASWGGGLFRYIHSVGDTNGAGVIGSLTINGGGWDGSGYSNLDLVVLNSDHYRQTASVLINPFQAYSLRHLIRDDAGGRNIDPAMYDIVNTGGLLQSLCRLPLLYSSDQGISRCIVGDTAMASFLAPTTNAWYRVMGGTTNFPGTGHVGGRLVVNSCRHSSEISVDVTPSGGADGALINVIRAAKASIWDSPCVTMVRAGSYWDPSVNDARPFVDIYVDHTLGTGDPGIDKIMLGYPIEGENLYTTHGGVPLVVPTVPVTSLVPSGCTLNQCVTNSLIR